MPLIPPNEKIIEKKICRISGQEFFVTDKDLAFYEKISPIFGGQKYLISSPTLCPDERMRRRLSFRNERKLYHRKCDKTGNQIISIYSPDKPYTVYDQKVWWGDDWSAFDYGVDFDFNKPFFEQFNFLLEKVPRPHGMIKKSINSDFTNYMINSNNCYLCFASSWSENIAYCTHSTHSKETIDCTESDGLEKCYNLTDCRNCYHCYFGQKLVNCQECAYCFDMQGCNNCLYCTNIRDKSYYIFNKPVSKEDFTRKKQEISYQNHFFDLYKNMVIESIHRQNWNRESENIIGEYISNSKDAYFCYDVTCGENLKFCQISATSQRDSFDCSGSGGEKCYECSLPLNSFETLFSDQVTDSNAAMYSSLCFGVTNIFGCIGLHLNNKNCVLNKSFSALEYQEICQKIINHMQNTGEWAEYFPHSLSPFGYDETVAQEYFPIIPEEAQGRGWKWKGEEETSSYHGIYYVPLNIKQYDERIVGYEVAKNNINELLSGIIQCEITKKPFKIIKQELAFYIENGLPIPTKHPDQRHKERMTTRNSRELHERSCAECGKNMITSYAPDRPEKIVCESCYKKLIY